MMKRISLNTKDERERRKILGREGMHLSLEDRFLFVVTQSFCHRNPMATI